MEHARGDAELQRLYQAGPGWKKHEETDGWSHDRAGLKDRK